MRMSRFKKKLIHLSILSKNSLRVVQLPRLRELDRVVVIEQDQAVVKDKIEEVMPLPKHLTFKQS